MSEVQTTKPNECEERTKTWYESMHLETEEQDQTQMCITNFKTNPNQKNQLNFQGNRVKRTQESREIMKET